MFNHIPTFKASASKSKSLLPFSLEPGGRGVHRNLDRGPTETVNILHTRICERHGILIIMINSTITRI